MEGVIIVVCVMLVGCKFISLSNGLEEPEDEGFEFTEEPTVTLD